MENIEFYKILITKALGRSTPAREKLIRKILTHLKIFLYNHKKLVAFNEGRHPTRKRSLKKPPPPPHAKKAKKRDTRTPGFFYKIGHSK